MNVIFDKNAKKDSKAEEEVQTFLKEIETLEKNLNSTVIICQDGKSLAYYIRCSISVNIVCPLLDLNARLDPKSQDSFRANRELLLEHNTFKRMKLDAENGREFSDIIIEYSKEYTPEKPLKVWGGQHRSKAIQDALGKTKTPRYHGFRVYFCLSKKQRTELALISNTNINVSNDTFDRLLEETYVGTKLREWCYKVGLLKTQEDFPDVGSRSEKISVKLARTFIVNFFQGKQEGEKLSDNELDKHIYIPYLCESGASLDQKYSEIVDEFGESIWNDMSLLKAGKAFASLHKDQYEAVKNSKKIENRKSFWNKALTESVLSGWSFVAGLLQSHPNRLNNHLQIPKTTKNIPDPLNAKEMSLFRHEQDDATYRGLGTRSALKDRQRMAQVFLARSLVKNSALDRKLLNKAVSQVVGLKALERGYSK